MLFSANVLFHTRSHVESAKQLNSSSVNKRASDTVATKCLLKHP